MSVVILRGTSGSGKSTMANFLAKGGPVPDTSWVEEFRALRSKFIGEFADEGKPFQPYIFSADQYFTDGNGEYHFNPRALGDAHADCLRKYTNTLRDINNFQHRGNHLLIVDNTNCSIAEAAPYAALALAFHHDLQVYTFMAHPEVCAKRNIHGVSVEAIRRQAANLEKSISEWPPWWPSKVVPVTA